MIATNSSSDDVKKGKKLMVHITIWSISPQIESLLLNEEMNFENEIK